MAKILGIGNVVLDTVFTVDGMPKEDQEIRALNKLNHAGGNVQNTLYVLSQLGHSASICTTLATDNESKQLFKIMQERGILTEHIQTFIKGRTPNSFITRNAQNGLRTIIHYRDLPEVDFDFFARIEIEQFDWLHFEGRNLTQLPGMLNIAKTFLTGQPISLEVEKPRDGIEALFDQVNTLMFSHHYAQAKGYENGEEFLASLDLPKVNLVCTWGNKGVWYQSAQGSCHYLKAEQVDVIDTLGAGDTFNAGLIHALSDGQTFAEAVQFANHLAASKCSQIGLDYLLEASVQKEIKPLAHFNELSSAKTKVVKDNLGRSLILIKHTEEVKCYLNNCPHQNVPLNEAYKIDVNPFEKTMKCSVHDAYFNIEDGLCIDGPCWDEALQEVAIKVDETGAIFLQP